MNRIKTALAIAAVITLGFIYIADAENMLFAAKKGIDICLNTIIPSLYGFMVLSAFTINSGLHRYIFKPLYIILRHIIRLNEDEFAILMLSLISGYPVGAKLLTDYITYNHNYSAIAKYRIAYMYCGSPVFIISIVGLSIYGDIRTGLLVYISNALSCLVFAAICNINKSKTFKSASSRKSRVNQEIFLNSVISSGKALFTVCLTVVFFTILIQAVSSVGVTSFFGNKTKTILESILEISNITSFNKNQKALLPLISALTSFGGFCIIAQITMITKGIFSLKLFYLYRIPIALLSGFICYLITLGINIPIQATGDKYTVVRSEVTNPVASVSLIIMVLLFILNLTSKQHKIE